MAEERLQKVLAARGVASRRQAERWIEQGRVRVDGRVVTRLGTRVDPDVQVIEVDGRPLPARPPRVVVVLRKPPGYVTTVQDPHAGATVMDLLAGLPERVVPVGRLDRDTRGVLLFTNDGELAHRLLHPSRGVEKVYRVSARGRFDPRRLVAGVRLDDGPAAAVRVWEVERSGGMVRFSLALHGGRKRQVRRMVQALGGRVVDLERVAFGPIRAGDLPEGRWRHLTPDEIQALEQAAGRGEGRPEDPRQDAPWTT